MSIFRRIAVERYSQATPADVPEMLAPLSRLLILAGIALLCLAAALFRIP